MKQNLTIDQNGGKQVYIPRSAKPVTCPLEESMQLKSTHFILQREIPKNRAAEKVKRKVVITSQYGLHARPATEIVKVAKLFKNSAHLKVELLDSYGKIIREVNGESIMGLLMLAAGKGQKLMITAEGSKSKEAMDTIMRVLDEKGTSLFEEYRIPIVEPIDIAGKLVRLDYEVKHGREVLLDSLRKDLEKKSDKKSISHEEIVSLLNRFNLLYNFKGIRNEFYHAAGKTSPPLELSINIRGDGDIVLITIVNNGDLPIQIETNAISDELKRKSNLHVLHLPITESFGLLCSLLEGKSDHEYLVERLNFDAKEYSDRLRKALEAPYEEFEAHLGVLIGKRMECDHFDLLETA